MATYSQIVNKLWPKDRYPILRLRVYKISRILPNFFFVVGFLLWKLYSKIRFGITRWIQLDWGRLFVRSDDYRAYYIAQTAGTQKEIINTWINLVHLKPELCIDVGANYGEFTLAVRNFDIPSIAIEANPSIVNCLKYSFADYHNIYVVHAAVSDTNGCMSFYFNPQYSGGASMSKKTPTIKVFFGQRELINSVKVRSIRLDSLVLDELKMKPKSVVLKIDVETFELDVLNGALPLLAQCDWWRAIIEFNVDAIRKTNGKVDEMWKTYRKFNGQVIGQQAISEEKSRILTDNLPESPPSSPCDILIGQGFVNPIHDSNSDT